MKMARILLAAAWVAGCGDMAEEDEPVFEEGEGEIYIRFTDSCEPCPVYSFNDNNPAVPTNPIKGQFYGPSRPGTYQATFGACSANVSFKYRLEAPPPGQRRRYTQMLLKWRDGRCMTDTPDPSRGYDLTYSDEPM